MSGDAGSSTRTPDKALAELEEGLDRQMRALALPPIRRDAEVRNEATPWLSIDSQRLRAMTAEEAAEGAVLVAQLAYHAQACQNRFRSVVGWCEDTIRYLTAWEVGDARGWSLEERRAVAVRNLPAAARVNQILVEARSRTTQLDYLAARLEQQSRTLENLSRNKMKHHD